MKFCQWSLCLLVLGLWLAFSCWVMNKYVGTRNGASCSSAPSHSSTRRDECSTNPRPSSTHYTHRAAPDSGVSSAAGHTFSFSVTFAVSTHLKNGNKLAQRGTVTWVRTPLLPQIPCKPTSQLLQDPYFSHCTN